MSDTPRGSWATFDLRQTASDPPLPGLLDRLAPDVIDNVNKLRRNELQLVCRSVFQARETSNE